MDDLTDRIDTGIQALAESSDSSAQPERDWESEYEQLVSRVGQMQASYEARARDILESLMASYQELEARHDMWRAGHAHGRRELIELTTNLVGKLRNLKAKADLP